MAKIIIEINDTPLGKTEVRCSVPWAELNKKHGNRSLAPGAEKLTWVAINAVQRHVLHESKKLFAKIPRHGSEQLKS